jgi:hypothetical protein
MNKTKRFLFVVEIESEEDNQEDARRVVTRLLDDGFDTGAYREIQVGNGYKSLVGVMPKKLDF